MSQYDSRAAAYAAIVDTDPVKRMQYMAAHDLLGDVRGQRILDVGCGGGQLADELIGRGATVVGYDNSASQIALASQTAPGARFILGGPTEALDALAGQERFDAAVALLVLMYAQDALELRQFFESTQQLLRLGGRFVGVVINPEFQRLGQVVHNRRFTRLANDRMRVEFLQHGQPVTDAVFSHFTVDEYRTAAGGKLDWRPLLIDESEDQEFWDGYNADPMYCSFSVSM